MLTLFFYYESPKIALFFFSSTSYVTVVDLCTFQNILEYSILIWWYVNKNITHGTVYILK